MRKSFCLRCFKREKCVRICKIVLAELSGKGIYKYGKGQETLKPKGKEVALVFENELPDIIRLNQ